MITETTNGFNIEGNQISINCMTSNQDNFFLDSEGNLTVNSITVRENSNNTINFLDIYPIGSIYMNTTLVDPNTLFGGTWQRIANGRTLVGVSENETDFNAPLKTGGEKKHQLTSMEMPNHSHGSHIHNVNGQTQSTPGYRISYLPTSTKGYVDYALMTKVGGNAPHNNLPPYITVYMWKRIS